MGLWVGRDLNYNLLLQPLHNQNMLAYNTGMHIPRLNNNEKIVTQIRSLSPYTDTQNHLPAAGKRSAPPSAMPITVGVELQ